MKGTYLLIHSHSTVCGGLVNVSIETAEWLLGQGYTGVSLWVLFFSFSNQWQSWVWSSL